jgi:hypothetical protein
MVPFVVGDAAGEASALPSSRAFFAGIVGLSAGAVVALAMQGRAARAQPRSGVRMDETILEKALAGELEEEGAENVFMSEAGWASYLDKEGQSYAMNERVSKASDGYFTADMFSNPIDVFKSWVGSMQSTVNDPASAAFMTISNDKSGNRTWGAGKTEVDSRTIKPKVKNFDKNMRVTGIPGYNMFGAPGAKSTLPNNFGKGKGIDGENDSGPSLVARGNKWLNENIIRKLDVPAPDLPQLNLPKVNLPKVNLPEVNLPEIQLPELPELPEFGEGKGSKKGRR